MKKLHVKLNGITPLLIHSNAGANPLHPLKRDIEKITRKQAKTKTEADHKALSDLEFQLSMYYDEKLGPVIPAENIEACIRDGAKKARKGKAAVSGIRVVQNVVPILYDGPRAMAALLADINYRDVRIAKTNGRGSVVRTRPRFNRWAVEFDVQYREETIDADDIESALVEAGYSCALGDYRPRYGQFEIAEFKERK